MCRGDVWGRLQIRGPAAQCPVSSSPGSPWWGVTQWGHESDDWLAWSGQHCFSWWSTAIAAGIAGAALTAAPSSMYKVNCAGQQHEVASKSALWQSIAC